jgi:hypothetical protein
VALVVGVLLRPRAGRVEQVEQQRQAQVHAHQARRVGVTELGADERAPVAARGCEPLVAERVAHRPHPQVGRAREVDPGRRHRHREAEARQRRHDDLERVGRVGAEGAGSASGRITLAVVPGGPRPAG